MAIDIRKSPLAEVLFWNRCLPTFLRAALISLSFLLFVFFGVCVFLDGSVLNLSLLQIQALAIISFIVFWFFLILELYLDYLKGLKGPFGFKEILKNQELAGKINWARYLEYNFFSCISSQRGRALPALKSLLEDGDYDAFLSFLQIDRRDFFRAMSEAFSGQDDFNPDNLFLSSAWLEDTAGRKMIHKEASLLALFYYFPPLKKIFETRKIFSRDLPLVLKAWKIREDGLRKKIFALEDLWKVRPLGLYWASGYTVTLDKYSFDLSRMNIPRLRVSSERVQLRRIENILAKKGFNNVLLVGAPGVGKTSLIYSFARRVATGQSLPELSYKRVVFLDMEAALAGLSDSGMIRERLGKIFFEASSAGNIILVIENFGNFIRAGGLSEGDISEIILPYLQLPRFQVIAVCSQQAFIKNIEPNRSLISAFVKVELPEMSYRETLMVLGEFASRRADVSFQAMKETIRLADKFIATAKNPQRSLGVLKEILAGFSSEEKRWLFETDIHAFFTRKFGIPLGNLKGKEADFLLNLESKIHKMVVNQEEAVKSICDALRRARVEIRNAEKPIASFLFLGPTGVGKTTVAKALASVYFGSEKNMVRFDMSEFQDPGATLRLIGSSNVEQGGLLTEAVKRKPFTLLLFDEIEKSHPDVLNLFLQMLDEGYINDGLGSRVNFTDTIIIATSNAGAEFIRENLDRFSQKEFYHRLLDFVQKKYVFRPEFLNRFDQIISFKPLSRESLLKIAQLLLEDLKERLKASQDINLLITPELKAYVVDNSFSPEFGARPMRRFIQDQVETFIAEKILRRAVSAGSDIVVDVKALGSTNSRK